MNNECGYTLQNRGICSEMSDEANEASYCNGDGGLRYKSCQSPERPDTRWTYANRPAARGTHERRRGVYREHAPLDKSDRGDVVESMYDVEVHRRTNEPGMAQV